MKRKTFTILFFIKRSKLLRNGEAPIYMRITVDGIRAEIGIQRSIILSDWLDKKGCAKATTAKNKELNHYLEHIRSRLYEIQKDLEDEGKIVTSTLLKNRYMGIDELKISFVELYTEHNDKLRDLIGKEFAPATLVRHQTSMNHFVKFLQSKYKQNDILLRDITPNIITEYEHYLKTVRDCANNTTVKYIRNVSKILNLAVQKDILKSNPVEKLNFRMQEVSKEFLTEAELETLMKKEFATDRLTHIRDIFAFCCFTGLSYIDVKNLRKEDFFSVNGKIVIRKQRQKTKVWYNVPLLPIAKKILEKYDGMKLPNNQLFPIPTNQKTNAYLKEIADVCGITKKLHFHMSRHTFGTTVTLANNISIESVSKMLGHKDIKMTQHYAKILESTVNREMAELSEKLNYTY